MALGWCGHTVQVGVGTQVRVDMEQAIIMVNRGKWKTTSMNQYTEFREFEAFAVVGASSYLSDKIWLGPSEVNLDT